MEQAWLPALALNPVARARNNGSYIKMTSSLTKKKKKKTVLSSERWRNRSAPGFCVAAAVR